MESCYPCVGPSPTNKIFSFLLSICINELISAPKIMVPSVNENSEQESNPATYPQYLYLSGSAFLVSFSDWNSNSLI